MPTLATPREKEAKPSPLLYPLLLLFHNVPCGCCQSLPACLTDRPTRCRCRGRYAVFLPIVPSVLSGLFQCQVAIHDYCFDGDGNGNDNGDDDDDDGDDDSSRVTSGRRQCIAAKQEEDHRVSSALACPSVYITNTAASLRCRCTSNSLTPQARNVSCLFCAKCTCASICIAP